MSGGFVITQQCPYKHYDQCYEVLCGYLRWCEKYPPLCIHATTIAVTFQRKSCINCSLCRKTETPFICTNILDGKKSSFWLKGRESAVPRQLHALLSDEPSQTDTLNLTQVQSSAEAHVASTWTESDRMKEKDPKEQKKFAETRLWVMYCWVLCLWELAGLLIFSPVMCACLCVSAMVIRFTFHWWA